MNQQTFIFIGPSGSGKGTQVQLLIDVLKKKDNRQILYIQTGQDLREFTKGDSYTQKLTAELLKGGNLIPEFLSVYTWIKHLIDEYDGTQHLMFDGTPRKLHEAGVLHSIFEVYKLGKPWVINMELSHDEALKRLLARNREDDHEEQIRKRLSWYETSVVPTIDYYKNNPAYNLVNINGEGSVEEIHREIVKKIGLE